MKAKGQEISDSYLVEETVTRRLASRDPLPKRYIGVPDELREECRKRMTKDMLAVLDRFEDKLCCSCILPC